MSYTYQSITIYLPSTYHIPTAYLPCIERYIPTIYLPYIYHVATTYLAYIYACTYVNSN